VARAITAFQQRSGTAPNQVAKCLDMRLCQITDVDVVAHAGTVGHSEILSEYRHSIALSECGLAGDLHEVAGFTVTLSSKASRVGPCHVEVTQRHHRQAMRCAAPASQQPFRDELAGAITADRVASLKLPHRHAIAQAVDGGGGREDEVPPTFRRASLNQT